MIHCLHNLCCLPSAPAALRPAHFIPPGLSPPPVTAEPPSLPYLPAAGAGAAGLSPAWCCGSPGQSRCCTGKAGTPETSTPRTDLTCRGEGVRLVSQSFSDFGARTSHTDVYREPRALQRHPQPRDPQCQTGLLGAPRGVENQLGKFNPVKLMCRVRKGRLWTRCHFWLS